MQYMLAKGKPQNQTKRDGLLIGVVGAQGSGKSLTMTYVGVTRKLTHDENLYSNYHLYGGFKYYYLNQKEDLFKEINDIHNSTLIVDEFHSYIDSYDWRDPITIDFIKQKMVNARRKGNYFIMGNQLRTQFPLRLRTIMPVWLLPYIKRKKRVKGRIIPHIVEVVEINKNVGKVLKWKFRANEIMNCYDTWENFDHLLLETNTQRKERMKSVKDDIMEESFNEVF